MALDTPHRWYGPPIAPPTPIYRHLPAARFEQLLDTRLLHFTRLDAYHKEGDQLEGRHSEPMRRWFMELARGSANEIWAGTTAIEDNERRLARRTAASCWTLHPRQPVEAWRRWRLGPGDVRVATTLGRLLAALDDRRLALGAVQYVDHASDWIRQHEDIVHLAFAKDREPWSWEQELRLALAPDALLQDLELPPDGEDLALADLRWIETVDLHPASTDRHRAVIAALLARHGLAS